MKNECSIIRDLLPLYAEDMVSGETAEFVCEHLEHCKDCRSEYESMKRGENEKPNTASEALSLKGLKRKMKRRLTKRVVLALIIGVALGGLMFFGNGIVGNPVSYVLAKHTAESYIKDNVFATGYYVYDVSYSMKDFGYTASMHAPWGVDNDFTLKIGMFGKLRYSTYEPDVIGHRNVARRITADYRETVNLLLGSRFMNCQHYALLETAPEEYKNYAPYYAIINEDLEPDKLYDLRKLGAKAGHITLSGFTPDKASYDAAAEILLELKKVFDENGQAFKAVDLTLTGADNVYGPDGLDENAVYLLGFEYDDIYEEGLNERIAEADKAAREILSQPVTPQS